jgi:hypothetical protein
VTKAWAVCEFQTTEIASATLERVNGFVWPPKNNKTVSAKIFSDFQTAVEAANPPKKVEEKKKPKTAEKEKAAPSEAKKQKQETNIDVLFKQTKTKPVLYFTHK